jgi:plasmid stabilization system protein ParE
MKLEFQEQAKQDLRWFRRYYASSFPEGRHNAEQNFRTTIEIVLANPRAGQPMEKMQVRKIKVLRTPFLMIYTVIGDTVEIIRVWDTRSDPDKLFES